MKTKTKQTKAAFATKTRQKTSRRRPFGPPALAFFGQGIFGNVPAFLLLLSLLWATACTLPTKQQVIDKLTGCPPYQEEVAFPSSREYVETANVTPVEEEEEIEPDYLDKMYKKVQDDFEEAGIDLEEITNGFKAKGIVIERQKGSDGYTKELRVSLDGDIAFASGSAKLTPKAKELVSKLGDALNEYPSTLAKIEGHTDSDGSAASNKRLSQRRAESVKRELITNKGVARPRIIQAIGYGEERPIAPNDTPANKAKNRRVEIKIVPGHAKTGFYLQSPQGPSCPTRAGLS